MSGTDNYTLTPHYSYIKPISLADDDLWGDHINLNWDSLDAKLYQIEFNGNYLPLAGGIMRGGISFGTMVGGSSTDLSKHISLYNNQVGLSVSGGGRFNYNTPSGFSHWWVCNGVDVAQLNGSGLSVLANLTVSAGSTLQGNAVIGPVGGSANLTLGNNTATQTSLIMNAAAATNRQILWVTGGVNRWNLTQAGLESGSDAGCNLTLFRFNDAGANQGAALTITRANGAVTLTGPLTVTNNVTVGTSGVVTLTLNGNTGASSTFVINGGAGQTHQMQWQVGGLLRWNNFIANAEGGSNAGSDWQLNRYNDAGAGLGAVLSFTRSTGLGTVFGDPTAALGIATKQYVDARPFLPLAGGTTTGNVGIGAAPPANAAASTLTAVTQIEARNLNVNAYLDNTAGGPVWRYIETGGAAVLNYGPGTTGLYLNSAPPGTAGAPITFNGQLVFDTGGNAAVNHNFSAAVNITAGNTVTAGGAVIANGNYVGLASGAFMQSDASYTYFRCDTAGWGWVYTRSNGNMQYQRGSDYITLFNIDGSGNITAPGNATVSGTITTSYVRSNGGVYPDATGNWRIFFDGTNRQNQYTPGYNWVWNVNTGTLGYFSPLGNQWYYPNTDGGSINWVAYVGGVGAYSNVSDERTKADIEDAPHGLAEILAIRPVTFRRWFQGIKDYSPRVELGFGARQLRDVLPEAVIEVPRSPKQWDAPGTLDEDEPILGVQAEAVLAAAVNAIKTLAGMNVSLTARVAALEQQRIH